MGDFKQNVGRENRAVLFCPYCGTRLDPGARFCKNCGEAIGSNIKEINSASQNLEEKYREEQNEPITERKIVYEGYLHKCPNCGEVLKSFMANCPTCGHEIRDTKNVGSVKEFASRLQQIEAQKMPETVVKKSLMKTVFGKDFNDKDEADEAKRAFRNQKESEKINLITNFPVPNTREDIMEFMLLVSSNIDVKKDLGDELTKAWLSKLEQVYQKAKISINDEDDLDQIKAIYEKKMLEIRSRKTKTILMWVGGIAIWFFLVGLLWNPVATVIIAIFVIILLIVFFNIVKRKFIQSKSSQWR